MDIKAYDVVQQMGNRGSNESVRAESLNEENLSLISIFLCGPGEFVTHTLHIHIIITYIQCNYAVVHKRLEDFLLHFKVFQNANLGNTTDMSGRLGATLVFNIIANAFMKQILFLAR